jgi:hypothetical protein
MNVFVASRVRWTIATSCRPRPGLLGRLRHEAIHDLGLEDDVGQALGRPVVHLPGDLAPQVFLGGEDHPRDPGRHRATLLDALLAARTGA